MRAIEYQPGGVAVAVTIAPMVLGLYFGKPIFFGLSLLIGLACAVLVWRFQVRPSFDALEKALP